MPHLPRDAQSKVQSVLEIASHLIRWISDPAQSSFPELDLYFAALPLPRNDVSYQQQIDLDQKGVQLWNACCKLGGEDLAGDEKMRVHMAQGQYKPDILSTEESLTRGCKARAFAWLLVESAAKYKPKECNALKKSLRCATRAAKGCLAVQDLQLASKIIERLAERQSQIQTAIGDQDDETKKCVAAIQAELLLLQMTLAWRRERFDLAEHFYSRFSEISSSQVDPSLHVNAVDLMYEIGQQMLQEEMSGLAVRWLERAASLIESMKNDGVDADIQDLRLNVLHTYVRALTMTDEPNAGIEAGRTLAILKADYGHKLAVTLLDLEILARDPSPNVHAYHTVLLQIVRTVHLIDTNHKIIMHYAHHLKTLSLTLALDAVKQYIIKRLAPEGTRERTEGVIVTFIWMAVSDVSHGLNPVELDADLTLYRQIWGSQLGPDAAHAVLLLLWKRIEDFSADAKDDPSVWYKVALNSLLANAGDHNVGKIQRKMLVYYMKLPNLQAAKDGLAQMNDKVKQHPLSLYLGYSIAVQCHDERGAEAILASIVKLKDKDNRLLLACVGETMKYGDQRQGAKLLQRVLDKFGDNLPVGVDKCALLRCTARLLLSILSQDESTDPEMLSRLCSIFRTAASLSTKLNSDPSKTESHFLRDECEWFQQNGQNAALQQAESWPAKYLIDLMEYSSQIQYPPGDQSFTTRTKQHSSSTFFQCVLYITEARRCESSWTIEDLPRTSYHAKERPNAQEIRSHLYHCSFNKYTELQKMLLEIQETQYLEDELKKNLTVLLPLAFEALIFMESHKMSKDGCLSDQNLIQCIDQASELSAPAKTFALMADLILSSTMTTDTDNDNVDQNDSIPRLPLPIAITLLSKVINAIRRQSDYDITKAARWIRCVVQLVLDHYSSRPGSTPTSRKTEEEENANAERDQSMDIISTIVDEALNLAREAHHHIESNTTHTATSTTAESSTATISKDRAETEVEPYPSDELQWLSTTLFNLGVDCYVLKKEDEAKKWVGKAIEVADALGRNPKEHGGDGGELAKVLKNRRGKMWKG